jgi:hypothetical protein
LKCEEYWGNVFIDLSMMTPQSFPTEFTTNSKSVSKDEVLKFFLSKMYYSSYTARVDSYFFKFPLSFWDFFLILISSINKLKDCCYLQNVILCLITLSFLTQISNVFIILQFFFYLNCSSAILWLRSSVFLALYVFVSLPSDISIPSSI